MAPALTITCGSCDKVNRDENRGQRWGGTHPLAPVVTGDLAFPSDMVWENDWCVHIHDYTTVLLSCFLAARLNNSHPLCLNTHTEVMSLWDLQPMLHTHRHTLTLTNLQLHLVIGGQTTVMWINLDSSYQRSRTGPSLDLAPNVFHSNDPAVTACMKAAAFPLCPQATETLILQVQNVSSQSEVGVSSKSYSLPYRRSLNMQPGLTLVKAAAVVEE